MRSTFKKSSIKASLAPVFKFADNGEQEDAMTKITSVEKRQVIHVLEGIKQAPEAQDKKVFGHR